MLGPLLDGEYYTLRSGCMGLYQCACELPAGRPSPNTPSSPGTLIMLLSANKLDQPVYVSRWHELWAKQWRALERLRRHSPPAMTTVRPLDESGRTTGLLFQHSQDDPEKYVAAGSIPEVLADVPCLTHSDIKLSPMASLFDFFASEEHESITPITMEALNQAYGFVLYRARSRLPDEGSAEAG